jgi:hypothetical protein
VSATARSAAPRRRFWAEAERGAADMETRSCGEEDGIKTFGEAARTVSLNGACRAAGGDLWSSSGLPPGGPRAKKLLPITFAFSLHCLRHRRHGWRERPKAKRPEQRSCRLRSRFNGASWAHVHTAVANFDRSARHQVSTSLSAADTCCRTRSCGPPGDLAEAAPARGGGASRWVAPPTHNSVPQ